MPLSKKGTYHANPQIARMHDAAEPQGSEPEGAAATGGAHAIEIHHPNHPETGDGQNFHVRVHHEDGNIEESKHPSYEDAEDHAGQASGFKTEADEGENEADDYNDAGEESESDADEEY